jgi:hypothetical protein
MPPLVVLAGVAAAVGEALAVRLLELLELLLELPHAAMNAASEVAAAAEPIDLPAIFRKRLRATSSRASSTTAPSAG